MIKEMKTMKIWRKLRLSKGFANSFASFRAKAIYVIMFMMLAAFSFVACSDDKDGDWDPMVWKAEVPLQKTTDGIYHVSHTGGELTFSCRNYSGPWISDAMSNGEYYFPPREKNNYHTITADWFKAEISGNKLKVVFEPNDSKDERPLQLTVTAGDIFHTFKFEQFANK